MEYIVEHVSVVKCANEGGTSTKKITELLEYVSGQNYSSQSRLRNILDRLIVSLYKKKPDIANDSDICKCGLYNFQSINGNYQASLQFQLLNGLRLADIDSFKELSMKTASLYCEESHAGEGILFVVRVKIQEDEGLIPYVMVIKCDFTEVDRLLSTTQLFEKVEHAILAELKKGLCFPYYSSDFGLDESRVKVYQLTNSKYFSKFLNLERPLLRQETYTQVLVNNLKEKYDTDMAQEFEAFALNKVSEKKVDFDDVGFSQRLERQEVVELIEEMVVKDVHYGNKPSKLKIMLDEVEISCPVDVYGKKLLVGVHGKEKFIVIKGESLIDKGTVSPLTIQKLESLEKIIEELTKS